MKCPRCGKENPAEIHTCSLPDALAWAEQLEQTGIPAWQAEGAATELRRLQAENEALRAEYQSACGVVARMHLAATGQTIGPKRGVVEDVEDLRAEVEELRSRLQTTLSSGESHEDSLKSRDEALLRQALEALENFARFQRMMMDGPDVSDRLLAEDYAEAGFMKMATAIPALRTALAEPDVDPCIDGSCDCCWTDKESQNKAEQPAEQEPVAYIHCPSVAFDGKVRPVVSFEKYQDDYDSGIYSVRIPLYTAPQPAKR